MSKNTYKKITILCPGLFLNFKHISVIFMLFLILILYNFVNTLKEIKKTHLKICVITQYEMQLYR